MPPTKTPKQLREESKSKVEQAKKLRDLAESEARAISSEEEKTIFTCLSESESLQKSAELYEKIQSADDRISAPVNKPELAEIVDPNFAVTFRVAADPKDHVKDGKFGFRSAGEFFMAVRRAMTPGDGLRDSRLDFLAATGAQQAVGSDGGWLVPPTFSNVIWDGLNKGVQSLYSMTDNYTVDGESLTFPANAETSRATGSRYGGIRAYWINEAQQITASQVKFRQVKLEPNELAVLCYVTDKLLRNATALEQYLTRAAVEEINFLTSDAIINGNGAGKPLGILNSGGKISQAKETGQAADTFLPRNVLKMWSRLHSRSRPSAVWLINQDVEPQLYDMIVIKNVAGTENVGGAGSPYFNPENFTLMGRPIIPIEYCPTLGDEGDVILVDLKAYATGTQGGIDSASSMHLKFDFAETAFRFMFRVDGQPWLQTPLTPFKGTLTTSPYVTLADRA